MAVAQRCRQQRADCAEPAKIAVTGMCVHEHRATAHKCTQHATRALDGKQVCTPCKDAGCYPCFIHPVSVDLLVVG